MQEVKSTGTPIRYNDWLLRLIACIIAAHIVTAYGEDIAFFDMLTMPHYYYSFVPSIIIGMILFGIIREINIRLDKKFDWTEKPVHRITTQIFFSLILPALAAFFLAFIYFTLRGKDIFKTTYLQYDYQFILLMLLVVNLYYIVYYFYHKWAHAEKTVRLLSSQWSDPDQPTRTTFQVSKGAQNILLDLNQIAYFFRQDEINYLRTVSKEDYFINISLDEVQRQLSEEIFFRANRQLIVHRNSVRRYDLLTYGKLQAIIEPPFEDTIVSSIKAATFKKWIESTKP